MPGAERVRPGAGGAVHGELRAVAAAQVEPDPGALGLLGGLRSGVRPGRVGAPQRAHQPPAAERLDGALPETRQPVDGGRPPALGRQPQPVGRRQAGRGRRPAVGVDDQGRAGHLGEQRGGDGAQPVQRLQAAGAQLGLGEAGGGGGQLEQVGLGAARRGADVDHAGQPAGTGIVDGGGDTRPGVVAAQVVLGGVHLHRALGAQGGADAVGADVLLDPARADEKTDAVGAATQLPLALVPQHVALGVGDGEDQRGFGERVEQGAAQDAHHFVEAAGVPAVLDLGRAEVDGGGPAVRVQAEPAQAVPGVADHGARGGGVRVPDGGSLVDGGQLGSGRRGGGRLSGAAPGLPHSAPSGRRPGTSWLTP